MKQVVVDQVFRGCSVEEFAEVYFSEDFNTSVAPFVGMKERTLEEMKPLDGGLEQRRVKMVPSVNLPKAVQKLTGGADIVYYEVSTYDPAKQVVDYRIDSDANDTIDVRGRISFLPVDGGVRRLIEGTVKVSIFGLGGIIERVIDNEVKKGYDKIGTYMQKYIDENIEAMRSKANEGNA